MGDFAHWYYGLVPRMILHVCRGSTRQIFYGLSLPLLVKTLFAPWRRDEQSLEGLSLVDRLRVWGENLTSRFVGAILRIMTLAAGGLIVLLQLALFGLGFLLWVFLPFVAVAAISIGLNLIGGGS